MNLEGIFCSGDNHPENQSLHRKKSFASESKSLKGKKQVIFGDKIT